MRLARNLLYNLVTLAFWPLRALLRLLFAARVPPAVAVVLKGPLRYRDPPRRLFSRFSRSSAGPSLEALAVHARRIATAQRCGAVLIELRGVLGTQAQWAELGRMLAELKAAGKKVAIFAESLSGTAYAAVCGADLIALPPSGSLELVGVGAEVTHAGAFFAKVGVRPRFARREAFKTAPELFTDSETSPEQRATLDKILDGTFAALRRSLSRRGLDDAGALAAIDGGPYSGRTALAAGLIDRVAFHDEMEALVRGLAGAIEPTKDRDTELPPPSVLSRTSRLAPLTLRSPRRPKGLALVPLEGVIASGKSRAVLGMGTVLGSESATAALQEARRDRRSAAAVVTLDSRGGSALASEIVWREVTRLAAEKPTLVYIDSMAASGGYLIACGAPRILAAPLSVVGSIGAFSGHFDLSGLLERLGVRSEFVGRGARAGLGRAGALGGSEWQAVEALTEDVYASFMKIVADGRRKTLEEVRAVAQGKVYLGEEALSLGLVDRTCGFEDALDEGRKAGGLADDVPVQTFGEAGRASLTSTLASLAQQD